MALLFLLSVVFFHQYINCNSIFRCSRTMAGTFTIYTSAAIEAEFIKNCSQKLRLYSTMLLILSELYFSSSHFSAFVSSFMMVFAWYVFAGASFLPPFIIPLRCSKKNCFLKDVVFFVRIQTWSLATSSYIIELKNRLAYLMWLS